MPNENPIKSLNKGLYLKIFCLISGWLSSKDLKLSSEGFCIKGNLRNTRSKYCAWKFGLSLILVKKGYFVKNVNSVSLVSYPFKSFKNFNSFFLRTTSMWFLSNSIFKFRLKLLSCWTRIVVSYSAAKNSSDWGVNRSFSMHRNPVCSRWLSLKSMRSMSTPAYSLKILMIISTYTST